LHAADYARTGPVHRTIIADRIRTIGREEMPNLRIGIPAAFPPQYVAPWRRTTEVIQLEQERPVIATTGRLK
jgi:hypothetical protein